MTKAPKQAMAQHSELVTESPWQSLKKFTSARIALGRSGNSVPTKQLLDFQLDHARAIDAVHKALDLTSLVAQLQQSGIIQQLVSEQPIVLNTKAADRMVYLQRPDFGRQLSDTSWQQLEAFRASSEQAYDLSIVIADGLSSTAIQRHALPMLEQLLGELQQDAKHSWSLAPISVVTQGRVAVADDVGECLKAKITMILIGERPGLSSPDSMGIYLTWNPKRGAKDSSRNCISNIRPEGLNYPQASHKAFFLLSEALKLKLSGIGLKDRTETEDTDPALNASGSSNFLLGD
ncbi:ethanolamine ammonia-lyase subunit EutC [Agarivorans gilvus]|uniref:Ethanolamine ammonia-lyase small subunit n=1 Tax=Agarivorans gilvus TaxID=680279 RepID=A0ABQ1I273_9ALTE|nr:ethanolamine ammonia-lyase subunit EutC [Agarivorans gilvus]GGB05307.1 ethanolamine ammonia-lyase light chain [Agarivorans gilvus]